MSMTDIWLVRHGEASGGFGEDIDPGLSPLGHEQAQTAARLLAPVVPESARLLTSPKRRALETGAPFATSKGQDLEVHPCFIELPSPRDLAQRRTWIEQVLKASWSDLPAQVAVWQADIFSALQACTTPTVVFTHFLVINAVASKITGEDTVVQCLPDNGSVHHLRIHDDDWHWASQGQMLESVVN